MAHLSGNHVSRITGEHSQIIDGEAVFCADAAMCGGTQDHAGQDVDTCDDCYCHTCETQTMAVHSDGSRTCGRCYMSRARDLGVIA